MTGDDASGETANQEKGITADDRERIREYLTKPPHLRSERDLLPDEQGD